MESEKTKSILPLDYDEDDSEEEEEEEELFDNSKVDWRVKGNLLRGKDFTVSNNGNCPRCQSNVFVFVILDELFPMGDMPEILYNLLAKGKAVLWSSQDKQACKKPPTFMCKGFCPADPLGAGFNINWDTVNLTKLLKDLLKLNMAKAQKELQLKEKGDMKDDEEDADEKDIIRVMLAKEKEKEDDGEEEEETKVTVVAETITEEVKTETSTSPVEPTVSKPTTVATVSTTQTLTTTAESNVEYPISKDGSCPYCSSKDVRYIILIKESNKEASLPPTLESLLKQGKAFKMAKGASNTPSFQCRSCKYGFNLDWSATNLQTIFELDQSGAAVTTAATMTTSVAYQFPSYAPPMYQPAANHYTGYAPYGYPPMYYPPHTMPYAYPPAAYGIPPTGVPHMQATPPPYAYCAPLRNPHPTGLPPSGGPQMYRMPPGNPGMQPNVAHAMPPQAAGYANPYGHQGNYDQVPLRPTQMAARLRIPRGPSRGRRNNRNLRWISPQDHQMYNYHDTHEQWSSYTEEEARCNEDTEGTTEEVCEQPPLDPQAADRFEELLNQIDGKTENVDEAREDEKPPGEESQAEFEVTPFATKVQEKTKEPKKKAERNCSGEQNVPSDTMNNAQPENDPSRPEKIPAEDKSQEEVSAGDVDSISNSAQPQSIHSGGLNTQSQESSQDRTNTRSEKTPKDDKYELETDSKPSDSSGKESIQNSTTSAESDVVEEAEESPATASRKTKPRSRKRQSAGKKKAANTRVSKRKKVEKEPEEGNSEVVDENSSPVTQDESAEPQNNGGDVEEKAAEEETKTVRRMTRARAQKLKN